MNRADLGCASTKLLALLSNNLNMNIEAGLTPLVYLFGSYYGAMKTLGAQRTQSSELTSKTEGRTKGVEAWT